MEILRALDVGPEAPSAARESAIAAGEAVSPEVADAAAVVVSELVTNSVRHSGMGPGDVILVRIVATDSSVRLEVTDGGPGFRPVIRRPPVDAEGGWGLYLVENLADEWGVMDDGRLVWAQLQAA